MDFSPFFIIVGQKIEKKTPDVKRKQP